MSQQCEYCKISSSSGSTLLTYCTGSEWLSPRSIAFYEAMEHLGAAGWELVNVFQAGDPFNSLELYFKRPIEPGRAIDDAL
jgi:hypothetical protein